MAKYNIGEIVIITDGILNGRIGYIKDISEERQSYLVDVYSHRIFIDESHLLYYVGDMPHKRAGNACMLHCENKCNGMCKYCRFAIRDNPEIVSVYIKDTETRDEVYFYHKLIKLNKSKIKVGQPLFLTFKNGQTLIGEEVESIEGDHKVLTIITTTKIWTIC